MPGPVIPVTTRDVELRGPAGKLEALLEEPGPAPRAAAILCHPHPLHGGTMHNKVVYRAAKGAVSAGVAVLRFNFRGVGLSEGAHDGGPGEREDLAVVLGELALQYPHLPLMVGGYSFGASVGLRVAVENPRVAAGVGIGLALTSDSFAFLAGDDRPLLLVHGDDDPFGPEVDVRQLARRLGSHVRLELLRGANHFFDGALETVGAAVNRFCRQLWGGTGEGGRSA
jgi:alpha/beta superfamily hydrolase